MQCQIRAIVVILALVVSACGGGESASVSSIAPTTSQGPVSNGIDSVVLLTGTIDIPGAQGFGEPGFHERYVVTGELPESASGVTGELVVRLWDAGRPTQTCDQDHPLSGCVTVDWSDFEDRPGVPTGGVFDNRLTVVSAPNDLDLFLSEDRGLATEPDGYSPT